MNVDIAVSASRWRFVLATAAAFVLGVLHLASPRAIDRLTAFVLRGVSVRVND